MEERIIRAFIEDFQPRFNAILNGLGNHIQRVDISDVNAKMLRAYDKSIVKIASDRDLDIKQEIKFTLPRAKGEISYELYLKMQTFPAYTEYSQQIWGRIQELNTLSDE